MQLSADTSGLAGRRPATQDSPTQKSPSTFETATPVPRLVDWLVYAGIALCGLVKALFGVYHVEADTVAYLDLADAFHHHQWHALFNASWFPLYSALVAFAQAPSGFRPQYEIMAARLLNVPLGLFFVVSAVALADSIRRLMLARGLASVQLIPPRILALWTATFAFFFLSQDLIAIKPDALVSAFMILTVATTIRGLSDDRLALHALAGLFAALAFWTKSFAFPFFALWLLLAALAHLRRPRILGGLALSIVIFALIAGPYIAAISAAKGHLSIGDAGPVNSAWYINGADRFNPVSDFSVYHPGSAHAAFKHPGELLFKNPEITYYGGSKVYGTTPQWDDFSYWADGIASRFVLRESLDTIRKNLTAMALVVPMRLQAIVLLLALPIWGFTLPRASLPTPILVVVVLLAVVCAFSFALVHFESRYMTFAVVILGTLCAATAITSSSISTHRSLHYSVLLIASLLLLFDLQNTAREGKQARQEGADPLHGIYSAPVYSAGAQLASLYPPGTEVACLGDAACWADTMWARLAGLKMTAIIETGGGDATKSAEESCPKLQQNPDALDPLRQHHIRAVVARFDSGQPCSAAWMPLGASGRFFYLPL